MKIDIIITRHPALVAYLQEQGLADEATPIIEHASISDVKGKHVLGVLPHHLSQHCASITEVPMRLTKEDREAMQAGDLTLERVREVAGDPVTYQVYGPGQRHQMLHDAGTLQAQTMAQILGSVARLQRGMKLFRLGSWAPSDSPERLASLVAADLSDFGPMTDVEGPSFEPTAAPTYRQWRYHGGYGIVATYGRFVRAGSGARDLWGPWVDLGTLRAIDGDPEGCDVSAA